MITDRCPACYAVMAHPRPPQTAADLHYPSCPQLQPAPIPTQQGHTAYLLAEYEFDVTANFLIVKKRARKRH